MDTKNKNRRKNMKKIQTGQRKPAGTRAKLKVKREKCRQRVRLGQPREF